MTSSMTYLMVLTMKKKMEGKIKFIMSQRFEKSIFGMIGFQMENKSVQCIFDKCPPESTKNKKFNFFRSILICLISVLDATPRKDFKLMLTRWR